MVDCSCLLDNCSNVIKGTKLRLPKESLKQSETPIRREFGVPYRKERHLYLIIKASKNPPHEILHHEAVLILATAIVGVEMEVGFTKSVVVKEMMQHGNNAVCPLSHTEGLINQIVYL